MVEALTSVLMSVSPWVINVCHPVSLSREDVWDVLLGFSLLVNDPRVTVWTTCTLFKESANENHVIRPPTNCVMS